MKDNKTIKKLIPFTLCEACGEQATHLDISVHHDNDYKKYVLSIHPCLKNDFGFSYDLSFGDEPYRVYEKFAPTPRFNRKRLEELFGILLPIIKNLVDDKVSDEDFKQHLKDVTTAITNNQPIPVRKTAEVEETPWWDAV